MTTRNLAKLLCWRFDKVGDVATVTESHRRSCKRMPGDCASGPGLGKEGLDTMDLVKESNLWTIAT